MGVREVATISKLQERRKSMGLEGLEATSEDIGSHNPFLFLIPQALLRFNLAGQMHQSDFYSEAKFSHSSHPPEKNIQVDSITRQHGLKVKNDSNGSKLYLNGTVGD